MQEREEEEDEDGEELDEIQVKSTEILFIVLIADSTEGFFVDTSTQPSQL
jgi:hypothetical protein